jgi:hypothetical protein
MAYQSEISRANPTCFFFLIDQSASMLDPIMGVPGNQRKVDFVADALNKVIQTLIVTASKDVDVRRYYQIGALGYGGENEVVPAFGGSFGEQNLVWVDELYSRPLRVEDRIKKESDGVGGLIEVSTKFPIWIDPVANGRTPMCQALEMTREILEKWAKDHRLSYPPTVINLTDGEANDGDPRIPAKKIRELTTSDGSVILMTLHVSSNPDAKERFFPNTSELLPDEPSKLMFEMSSPITPAMFKTSEEILGIKLESNAKGIVYNAGIAGIVSALEIGTRPANLR